MALIRSYHTFM